MSFGKRLSALMKRKNVTQYRLSKDIGVSNSTIANWRGDLVRPEGDNLIKLTEYFGVSAEHLLNDADASSPKTEKSPVISDEAWEVAALVSQLSPESQALVKDLLRKLMTAPNLGS